jgi:anti-anti-sigma regulatory factor
VNNDDIVPGFDEEMDDSLAIRLEKVDAVEGCLLFVLSGYIYRDPTRIFMKRVTSAIDRGFIRLIFDFSGISTVSAGIYGFTTFLKMVKPRGGDIVLIRIESKVFEVFQLLGFSQFFTIRDTLDEAVCFFAQRSEEGKGTVFPRIFKCPICSHKVRAAKSGRFRCRKCRTILAVDPAGRASLS